MSRAANVSWLNLNILADQVKVKVKVKVKETVDITIVEVEWGSLKISSNYW